MGVPGAGPEAGHPYSPGQAAGPAEGNGRGGRDDNSTAWSRQAFREELTRFARVDSELTLELPRVCDILEPDNAIVHVGRILEKILKEHWRRSPGIQGHPSRGATFQTLIDKTLSDEPLEMIRAHVEVVQKMRNLAAHTGSVDEGDATDVVRRLVIILKWFARERKEMARAAARGAEPESGESSAEPATGSAAQPASDTGWPSSGFNEGDHPPSWSVTVTGPWVCVDIYDRPVIVAGDGPFLQTAGPGGSGNAVKGPGQDPITDLIATADGGALAVLTGETLAWAARDPGSWTPLTWVVARLPVPGAQLLAGTRRSAGVDLILADAGQTFRLRVDSRGATSSPARIWSSPARSAALVEPEGPELAIVSNGGELDLVNRTSQVLPPLPGHGWLAVDAAYAGTAWTFVGLRDAEDGSCLYVSRPGRRFKARLLNQPDAVQVGRGTLAGRVGSVIVTQAGTTLRVWRGEDLESALPVPAGHADDGGNG